MKNIICPLCGELIVVDLDLDEGQNVRCPFCREKFSYDSSLLRREITKELIETAIVRCCENPLQADFYHNAPDGAKLYIGLLFLGQIYGKGIARAEYMKLYSGVEPTLRKSDLLYLIKHEKDPQIICYLNQIAIKNEYGDLLAKKNDFVAVVRTQHEETAFPKERALAEASGCEPELMRSKEKQKGPKGSKCQSQRVPPSSGTMNAEALSRYRKDMASTELREVVSKLIRFLMLLIAISAVAVACWFLRRELPEGMHFIGKPVEKAPEAIPEAAPSAPKPQSEFESFLRVQAPIVKARFDSVSKMLEVVRDDRRKFEQEISMINAEAKVAAGEALVQKRMRLNSAEWAMMVFTSPVIAGLYERYQGESITNQAQQCERQIRSGLSAADGPTQEVFEGLDQYAFALMTRMIDKVRHAMVEREILWRGYKTEVAKLSNDLRTELLGAAFTESARVAEKRQMLEERLSSKSMTDDIQLKDLPSAPNPAKTRGDIFPLSEKSVMKKDCLSSALSTSKEGYFSHAAISTDDTRGVLDDSGRKVRAGHAGQVADTDSEGIEELITAMAKRIAETERAKRKVDKENPCVMYADEDNVSMNVKKTMDRGNGKYSKGVTLINRTFYCPVHKRSSGCFKKYYDGSTWCKKAEFALAQWRNLKEKIGKTNECSEKSESLAAEIDELNKHLAELKVRAREAKKVSVNGKPDK